MLDAEERKPDAAGERITPEDLADAERRQLIDEAHLTVFLTWYQLGGIEHPPTITEIAGWPDALRRDLLYLLSELGRMRRQRRKRKAAK